MGAAGQIPLADPLQSPIRVSDGTEVPKADPQALLSTIATRYVFQNKTLQNVRSETSSRELKRKPLIVLFGERKQSS